MIHFVGAGPGAVDLITVRGQRYLKEADVIIYAGSLVNKGPDSLSVLTVSSQPLTLEAVTVSDIAPVS